MFDILGVGFGPSNLALSVCVREYNEQLPLGRLPLQCLFLERQTCFTWHEDMLLDDATMQISYLKDLVTLRDPTSRFSFLNYLKQSGRLEDFINLKTFHPTRHEYSSYLRWVAQQQADQVRYSSRVEEIRLAVEQGGRRHIEVVSRDMQTRHVSTHTARNVVLASGLQPKLPEGIRESRIVAHSAHFLSMLERLDGQPVKRFLVVGGGQSAAEVVNYLYDNYQDAEIVAVFSGFGYKPADESHFVNQIFDPQLVDMFYDAPEELRAFLLDRHGDTNYSVVDGHLIATLYRKVYEGKVRNRQRLHLRRLSRLQRLLADDNRATAFIQDARTGSASEESFDAVVLATGYSMPRLTDLVPHANDFAVRDERGEVALDRRYAVKMRGDIGGRVYLQGSSERQHGLTATLLSALPIRSQEIMQDIIEHRAASGVSHESRGVHCVG